jgi:hypothetical protein
MDGMILEVWKPSLEFKHGIGNEMWESEDMEGGELLSGIIPPWVE